MVLELRTGNQTIINDANFEYTIAMNDINKAEIVTMGNTAFQTNLLAIDSFVEIYRDGVLEFKGQIEGRENADGNSSKFILRGAEVVYVNDDCDITSLGTNGIWKNTASATIFTEILNDGVGFSAGTVEAGTNVDNRVARSDSLWNALMSMINKTNQEKYIDYVNSEIDIVDSVGTPNVDTLNEKADFPFLTFVEQKPKAKKVNVYGSGDGENQIFATATSGGYAAGTDNTVSIEDPTIISTSEAQTRANAELAALEQNIKIYTIPVNNPFKNYFVGDTLTINAPTYGIEGDSVRIVSITRGRKGDTDTMRIEVTNTEYARLIKSTKQKIASDAHKQRMKNTYMQGSGNTLTFKDSLNAQSSAPLRTIFQLPDSFIKDEAGNIRVNSFTVDYDVDPYRKEVGTASFDGTDPQVQNASANTQPTVSGVSGTVDLMAFEGSDIGTEDVSDTDWDELASEAVSGTIELLIAHVGIDINSGGPGDLWMRVVFAGDVYWQGRLASDSQGGDKYVRTVVIPVLQSISSRVDIDAQIISGSVVNASTQLDVYQQDLGHFHNDGSYAAANHLHNDGSYDINANDINDISIGDAVSDAGALNATSVELRLYHWSGSAWILKNTVSALGVVPTLDEDISNSGTYPDASGFWKVETEPNGGSPDFVQAIIKLKHKLDS